MADKTIDELTAGAPAVSSDEIPVWRSGDTYKLALSDLSGVVGAGDTLHTVASSTSTLTINYTTANVWDITLSANCTFTLAGLMNAKPDYLTLVIRQDGTGSRTVTWPTITWIGTGLAPVLQTGAGSVDSVVLFSFDGGSTVFGIAQTSASGLRAGSSFPGSPSDADLFYRTDRRVLYEYDTTSTHWLSVDRKYMTFSIGSFLDGVTTTGVLGNYPVFEDIYIERWVCTTWVQTTNNGSNFYTFTLKKQDSAGANTTITSFATSADAASTNVVHNVTVGATVSAASFTLLQESVTNTGAPGAHFVGSLLVLRSVG